MEARRRTGWDAAGLVISRDGGDVHVPLLAGAMHYWRVEPRRWRACLRALVELGVRQVETYVPWSVHEVAAGKYDWSGARDLGAFLDAAGEAGLGAIVRPGPHCNAELTDFGYPERVLRDDAIRARAAHGGPVWLPAPPRAFPVPSYASGRFHAEVAQWYAAVAEVVAPRLAPDGPVVAIGVDNEAQMFFRLGAFDHDYHPEALAWWREAGGHGEPPRRWEPDDDAAQARAVAWVRFKDQLTARALGELAGALDRAGLGGVARFHNLPPGEPWWSELPEVARAVGGPAGIDVYAGRRDLATIQRRVLHLVGSAEPLPLVPEVGVGFAPWLPPIAEDEQQDALLAALAWGARGLSLYMGVGRDRWYGGAIAPDGTPRAAAAWLRPLLASLREVEWETLRRPVDVALVVSRADARWGLASSWLDPVTPVVAEMIGLGPAGAAELGRDAAAVRHRRWIAAIERALALAQVPYVLVDERCPAERLASFRAIVAPTFDRIDRALVDKLRAAVDAKRVVVIGPDTPTLDELGRPLDAALPRRVGRMRAGSVDDIEGLAEDLAGLVDEREAWTIERGHDVDCAAHVDASGAARAVFVVNHSAKAARAVVRTPGKVAARDAISGERIDGGDGGLEVAVAPHTVRMLVVE